MTELVLLMLSLWVFGAAVGADHMTHWINTRTRSIEENGPLARRVGNNATKWIRAAIGVTPTVLALLHPEPWAVWVTASWLLILGYYTAGVAWRNGLIAIGKGHLERDYESTLWRRIAWIRWAWR